MAGMRQGRVGLAGVLACGLVLAAGGEARANDPDGAGELHVNRAFSITFSAVGGLAYILTGSVAKDALAPDACRWCDGDGLNGLDEGARDALKWDDVGAARSWSNVTGYLAEPLVGFGALALLAWREDASAEQLLDDQLIVMEAVVGAALLNQGVKFLAGRERPFVRVLPDDQKGQSNDENLSFFSGHASLTFSIAVASGTVATLRHYRGAPYIWATGLTLAATTGYLRIAGDKHYFTDVLTGAVVGSFVGFAVPYWLHRSGGAGGGEAALGAGWSSGPIISWSGTF
jgi:membrane-associated phospholipid phosphatase